MNTYTYKFLIPLINFNSNCEKISFSNNLKIVKINEIQKESIKELLRNWQNAKLGDFLLKSVLDIKKPEIKKNDYFSKARIEVEKIVTILRLMELVCEVLKNNYNKGGINV